MKSKSTSNFQRNFIFNACMNQSQLPHREHQVTDPNFIHKNRKKLLPSRTFDRPLSLNYLNADKKLKFNKQQPVYSPLQNNLQTNAPHKLSHNPMLANSSYHPRQRKDGYEDLVQSQHNRKSRYSGNKIKIFSNQTQNQNFYNNRGKYLSRQSYGTSNSRQKRGIQVTKTLLKRISGIYSDNDFGRDSQQNTSNRSSQYLRNQKKQQQRDSFQNHTGFMMTTWDSQRTTQEYQLTKDYQSANNRTRNQGIRFSTLNVLNGLNTSAQTNTLGIVQHSKPVYCFAYSNNQIPEYSSRYDSNNSISDVTLKGKGNTNNTSLNSIKNHQNPGNSQSSSKNQQFYVPLPMQYQQRPSYHFTFKQPETKGRQLPSSSSNSKGNKMLTSKMSQSKCISPHTKLMSPHTKMISPQLRMTSPQLSKCLPESKLGSSNSLKSHKKSLMFNKRKESHSLATNIQIKGPLFETAHQILSQEISSIKHPYFHLNKSFSGQQLTNLLYGNKNISEHEQNRMKRMKQEQRQKYVLRYKNKTLEDLSVKESLISNFDDYNQ